MWSVWGKNHVFSPQFPSPQIVVECEEPIVLATIIAPDDYTSAVMSLILVSMLKPNDFLQGQLQSYIQASPISFSV